MTETDSLEELVIPHHLTRFVGSIPPLLPNESEENYYKLFDMMADEIAPTTTLEWFDREVFEKVGFFDERLGAGAAGCSDDSEFWHRVLTHGGVCRYEPSAVAYHFHRRDWAGLSDQIFYYMRGHAAALLVQFERSGDLGNLRRALLTMPLMYARRTVRYLVKKPAECDRFLGREIAGYFSGLFFYLHHSRFAQKLVTK
jgi:hypothetical protein